MVGGGHLPSTNLGQHLKVPPYHIQGQGHGCGSVPATSQAVPGLEVFTVQWTAPENSVGASRAALSAVLQQSLRLTC